MRITHWPAYLLPILVILSMTWPIRAKGADVAPQAPYEKAVEMLESFIQQEITDKDLPALSIALVDGQNVVWSRGFGVADLEDETPATADTVYRVGSVSKLFTDIAAMQLVEQGKLDLDAPVSRYLPEFEPENPFDDTPVTLRRLMSHRSGMVREPPIGNYLDATEPVAERVIASFGETTLAYPPETRTKYSNGAIATVGRVVEVVSGRPFDDYVKRSILGPLGMRSSGFTLTPDLEPRLADAVMWTLDGREFPAPRFAIATVPAGNLYSTVNDLARFLSALFADGRGPEGPIVTPETLREMTTPQCVPEGERGRFGLGFALGTLDGHPTIGHGGAVYGFATSLAALPDERLGVVVATSRDCANTSTERIAQYALRLMLAAKAGADLPVMESTEPIEPARTRELAGHYVHEDKSFDLIDRGGSLFFSSPGGGPPKRLRAIENDLIVEDRLAHGPRLVIRDDRTILRDDLAFNRARGEQARHRPGALEGPDRRVWRRPHCPLHPGDGRETACPDRVVRAGPADRDRAERLRVPQLQHVRRRASGLHPRRRRPRDPRRRGGHGPRSPAAPGGVRGDLPGRAPAAGRRASTRGAGRDASRGAGGFPHPGTRRSDHA